MTATTSSPPCLSRRNIWPAICRTYQATTAIEEALRTITGRILAFRLITGDSLADWEAQKARDASSSRPAEAPPTFLRPSEIAEPPPAFFRSESSLPPRRTSEPAPAEPTPTGS